MGETTKLPEGVFSSGNSSGTANYGTWWFWLGLALIVVLLLLVGNLERSRVEPGVGRHPEDEDAAEVMGVNTFRFKLWAFVIGAAIGGLSGRSMRVRCSTSRRRRSTSSTRCCSCVPLSRWSGQQLGVIFGAFLIVYLPNRLLGVEFLGINLGDLKYLFFGLALVVMMIFRPQGLFPVRQQLLAYGTAARRLLATADDSKAAS